MNLFTIESTPEESARNVCDKHAVKMILESTQMISHYMKMKHANSVSSVSLPNLGKAHHSHPVMLWTLRSVENASWHLRHLIELNRTYTERYGRLHVHEPLLSLFQSSIVIDADIPKFFPVCVHDDCYAKGVVKKIGTLDETIESYRTDYIKYKSSFAKWKMGNVPIWYNAA